jgi:hypothetical protein
MTQLLFGVVTALVVAEFCRILERIAYRFVAWSVRLAHGQTPRAEARLIELTGDLGDCRGQITQFLFALNLLVRGIVDWLHRRSGEPDDTKVSHFAGAAVEALCCVMHGIELRGMPREHRREFDRCLQRLRDLLQHPAEAFPEEVAVKLLRTTARACEAHIDDRNERTALSLALATGPHRERLGTCHPATLRLRRVHAHALLQLGRHRLAEKLLGELKQDEAMRFGPDDPRTFSTLQLLAWALAEQGRFSSAEECLSALETRLVQSPVPNVTLLRHVQCKLSWVIGRQPGRLAEARNAMTVSSGTGPTSWVRTTATHSTPGTPRARCSCWLEMGPRRTRCSCHYWATAVGSRVPGTRTPWSPGNISPWPALSCSRSMSRRTGEPFVSSAASGEHRSSASTANTH